MNVSIIGAGYVGLVTAGGLAHLGHSIRVGEASPERVAMLMSGGLPIYEEGLEELLEAARSSGSISFHASNVEAVVNADLVMLCLPTPPDETGRADLSYVESVIDEVANAVPEGATFVIKSTVPPGTVATLRKRLADLGSEAGIVSHPEFLREGKAVADFLQPDRIVVGAFDEAEAQRVADLYEGIQAPAVITDPTSAEMIKYASNAYLAARLTFVNSLASLCEAVGADVLDVVEGLGGDHRIGRHFLRPGPGYGGSCFPKDTSALIEVASDAGYDFKLLKAVIEADDEQRRRIADKVRQAAGGGLRGRRIGMWGVAFKAGTDDVRESPALRIAQLLEAEGAEVVAYDPEAKTDLVTLVASPLEAARDADVLLVTTEWPQFSVVDLKETARAMRGHRVVDARNLLDAAAVRGAGLDYWGLGRPGA